jgi:hypothetical protein
LATVRTEQASLAEKQRPEVGYEIVAQRKRRKRDASDRKDFCWKGAKGNQSKNKLKARQTEAAGSS